MASYSVKKVEKTLAFDLANNRSDLNPHYNEATDEAFMYNDEAEAVLQPIQYESYELTEDANEGTLPIHPNKPRKPMYPR